MTTRTEELLAEGVITRLDVMVEETSATVAGLNKLLPQADRLEDMLVEVVQQRFGDNTVRAMLRSGGTQVEAASVPRRHQAAFAAVSRTVHTLKEGEHANVRQSEAARLTQRQALGYRRALKP